MPLDTCRLRILGAIALGVAALITARSVVSEARAATVTATADPAVSTSWVLVPAQRALLMDPSGEIYDRFGSAVAVSGSTAVIAAPADDSSTGSVSVFVHDGASWSFQARLVAADGAPGDEFGTSVAIDGDTVVVGAWLDTVGATYEQGSAYVFVRDAGAWSQQAKLAASDGTPTSEFGAAVDVAGDTVAVGAPNRGVYVFAREGDTWSQQAKLTAADDSNASLYVHSVAISGDTLIAGAGWDDSGTGTPLVKESQGSAYVYRRTGTEWAFEQKLRAADGEESDQFGWGVDVAGDTVAVGVPGDATGKGSLRVFIRSEGVWSQQKSLTDSAGSTGDQLGYSVALSGDVVAGGSVLDFVGGRQAQGSASVFARSGESWSQQTKLTAANGAANDVLGSSIAVSGAVVVVGAPQDDIGEARNQGSALAAILADVVRPGRPTARSPKGTIATRTPVFRWAAAARATSYEVRVYRGGTLVKKKTGITATSWKCSTKLPRGAYLTWKVRARNAAGDGVWSAALRFRVR